MTNGEYQDFVFRFSFFVLRLGLRLCVPGFHRVCLCRLRRMVLASGALWRRRIR